MEAWKACSETDAQSQKEYVDEQMESKKEVYITRSKSAGNKVHQAHVTPLANLIRLWNILPQTIRQETVKKKVKTKSVEFAASQAALLN